MRLVPELVHGLQDAAAEAAEEHEEEGRSDGEDESSDDDDEAEEEGEDSIPGDSVTAEDRDSTDGEVDAYELEGYAPL
ncbi:hypothetical protein GY45DRAFT_379297 [Cubamyces sp. BRFM 1775]|nr:hypothetical protein GY45DRAFT_379297 [Cubamyces sp. BRFM 1775]